MSTKTIPDAKAVPRARTLTYIYMIPVIALVVAAWLIGQAWHQQGRNITVHFDQGHGIAAGDELRFRGIRVGTISRVVLTPALDTVRVELRIRPDADDLAKAGSQFWIVRPQIAFDGIGGLDTVIGDNYLSVLPGNGEPQTEFIGLESAPPYGAIEPGGLEITLAAAGKGSLKAGAPITYRQVIIGTITRVDLAKDATAVEAHAYIKRDYKNLIRSNVKFWRAGGARLSAGLSGLEFAMDSVHSLILGGINLAIPPQPGSAAERNERFTLHDKPENGWLSWTPGLSLYNETTQIQRPALIAAERRWRYKNWWYQTRNASRRGWLVALPGGLLGPANILLPPGEAIENSPRLRINDHVVNPISSAQVRPNGLGWLAYTDHDQPVWPLPRTRTPSVPESSFVIGSNRTPRFIGAERFVPDEEHNIWHIDRDLPFDASVHGAPVVAEIDGALLGLLLINDEGADLALWPGEFEKDSSPTEEQPAD